MQSDPKSTTGPVADYLALIKFRLLTLVVISTGMGFYLATAEWPGFSDFISVLAGVALVGGGANGLNQWYERRIDVLMTRTSGRPLPSNRIPASHAFLFTVFISVAGFAVLFLGVNRLTLMLSFLSWATYLFLYTPLKRISVLNTWLGAIPGALPALLGYTAASGQIDSQGAALFFVLYFWQMPHFFAISWVCREDYERGGFKMLSLGDTNGDRTAFHILLHTVLMIIASGAIYYYSLAGLIYATGAVVIGVASLYVAVRFYQTRELSDARKVFRMSLLYIPGMFLSLIVDRLLLF